MGEEREARGQGRRKKNKAKRGWKAHKDEGRDRRINIRNERSGG